MRAPSLSFKQRIWLIPIVAIAAFLVGVAMAQSSNRTASQLVAVDEPALAHAGDFAKALEEARLALQAAAQEGDKRGLDTAQAHAARARAALARLRAVAGKDATAAELAASFENYWSAAMTASRLLLGEGQGDAQQAVRAMQAAQKPLEQQAAAALEDGRSRFRASIAATASAIDRASAITAALALVVAIGLSLLSWFIIRSVVAQLGGDPAAAARVVNRVASGDLTGSTGAGRGGDASLLADIARMQAALIAMLADMRDASERLLRAADGIAAGSEHLSGRTGQQAASLEETAAALVQITATVQQTAGNAGHLDQLTQQASAFTVDGGRVMQEVMVTMDRIKGDSGRMTEIVEVIDGIAFQTNILALNAAVEAARAGEQGRGFAVVAQEVRALALRSAKSALEIKTLLQACAGSVGEGVARVQLAAGGMADIQRAIQEVGAIVSEIAVASREQTAGLAGINRTVAQLESMTAENAQLAHHSVAAAQDVKDRAGQLGAAVTRFRLPQEARLRVALPAPGGGPGAVTP